MPKAFGGVGRARDTMEKKEPVGERTRRVTREAIHSHLEVLITLRYIRRGNIRYYAWLPEEPKNVKKIDSVTLVREQHIPLCSPTRFSSFHFFFSLLSAFFFLLLPLFRFICLSRSSLFPSTSLSIRWRKEAPGNQARVNQERGDYHHHCPECINEHTQHTKTSKKTKTWKKKKVYKIFKSTENVSYRPGR